MSMIKKVTATAPANPDNLLLFARIRVFILES